MGGQADTSNLGAGEQEALTFFARLGDLRRKLMLNHGQILWKS